jgi:hypothetical protein
MSKDLVTDVLIVGAIAISGYLAYKKLTAPKTAAQVTSGPHGGHPHGGHPHHHGGRGRGWGGGGWWLGPAYSIDDECSYNPDPLNCRWDSVLGRWVPK